MTPSHPRALLLHGLGASPADLDVLDRALRAAGWETSAPALLAHDGRPAAPRYALDDYAAEFAATGPWDLVIGHSLGGCLATIRGAQSRRWAARMLLIEPVWRIRPEHIASVAAGQRADLDTSEADLAA
ncbi:MAG: alpha/beta fold hydrolase [Actinomycetales bacterium]|nr:alpha/beta fold hydrolase [Actinomycetales bacterium]